MADEKHEQESSELSDREIYRALDQDFIEEDFDGKGNTLIGEMHGNMLWRIEAFIDDLIASEDLAFERAGARLEPLRMAKYFKMMPMFLREERRRYSYSPKVRQFFKAARQLEALTFRAPQMPMDASTEGEIFNEFIRTLRTDCRSPAFGLQLRRQDIRTKRRLRKLYAYVEKLFQLYSRILVIRIDLLYKGDGEPITLERLLQDYARLVNNGRHNNVFDFKIGSIRRLEYGAKDHHHIHAVFFFDGSKVWKDAFIAEMIGTYWTKITGGRGHFHNCNRAKNKYKQLGIGMISHDDDAMRANLMLALKYLVKKEQLLWVKPEQKVRAIECGRLGNKDHSGLGRPRRVRQ